MTARVMVDEVQVWPHAKGCFRSGSCHLTVENGDVEALHAFAARIGLKRSWFQDKSTPHYDLTPGKREAALRMGAVFVSARDQAITRLVARERKRMEVAT